jgi:hypothetical protein
MSIEAMAISLHHSKTQGATKLVLLGIANHEGDGGAWPAISTLARYAGGVNRRTVQRAIQELIDLGEISCEVNGGGYGDAKPNLYRVTLRCPQNCDGSTAHRKTEGGGLGVTPGGGLGVTGGAVWMSPKPSIEPSIKNHPFNAQKIERLFDLFWEVYPRRVGKIAARKAFIKAIKTEDAEMIIESARSFANDPNQPTSKQFIAHPTTWLNEGRWSDGPLPDRVRTAEELAVIAREKYEQDREASLRASERRSAEEARIRAEALANPPERCEHDRVKVVCPKCSDFGRSFTKVDPERNS